MASDPSQQCSSRLHGQASASEGTDDSNGTVISKDVVEAMDIDEYTTGVTSSSSIAAPSIIVAPSPSSTAVIGSASSDEGRTSSSGSSSSAASSVATSSGEKRKRSDSPNTVLFARPTKEATLQRALRKLDSTIANRRRRKKRLDDPGPPDDTRPTSPTSSTLAEKREPQPISNVAKFFMERDAYKKWALPFAQNPNTHHLFPPTTTLPGTELANLFFVEWLHFPGDKRVGVMHVHDVHMLVDGKIRCPTISQFPKVYGRLVDLSEGLLPPKLKTVFEDHALTIDMGSPADNKCEGKYITEADKAGAAEAVVDMLRSGKFSNLWQIRPRGAAPREAAKKHLVPRLKEANLLHYVSDFLEHERVYDEAEVAFIQAGNDYESSPDSVEAETNFLNALVVLEGTPKGLPHPSAPLYGGLSLPTMTLTVKCAAIDCARVAQLSEDQQKKLLGIVLQPEKVRKIVLGSRSERFRDMWEALGREKMSELISEGLKKFYETPRGEEARVKQSKRMSKRMTENWKDEDYRATMSELISAGLKELFEDPRSHEARANISAGQKKRFAGPGGDEARANLSARTTKHYAKKHAEKNTKEAAALGATLAPDEFLKLISAPPGKLGVKLWKDSDGHIRVGPVESGSPLEGRLFPGDRLIGLYGRSLVGKNEGEVATLLRNYDHCNRMLHVISSHPPLDN